MSEDVLAGRSRALDDRGSAAFRARFPPLGSRVHLASCSVAARSQDLTASLAQMLDDLAGGTAWEAFEEQVRAARRGFAELIGARPDQVALMPFASVGAYQWPLSWTGIRGR